MDPVTIALMAGGSALSGIGGYLGSQKQAGAALQAGNTNAIMQAIAMQQAQQRFSEAKGALTPYTDVGASTIGMLSKYLQGTGAQQAGVGGGGANLLSTFAPTMAQLEATPGYQFAREQGLGAMTNSAAAKGLGVSGNLVRGMGEYATGFASQTFNDQLKNYLMQNQQAFNMLYQPSQLGAQAGQAIMQGTSQFNPQMMAAAQGVGQSYGQGVMGSANAQAQGIESLFGGLGNAATIGGYYNDKYSNPLSGSKPTSVYSGPAFAQTPVGGYMSAGVPTINGMAIY